MVNSTSAHRYWSFPLAGDKCQKWAIHIRIQWQNRKTVFFCDRYRNACTSAWTRRTSLTLVQPGRRGKGKSKLCHPVTELKLLVCSLSPHIIATKPAPGIAVYMLIGHVTPERIFSSLVRLKSAGEGAQRMQVNVFLFMSVVLRGFTLLEELAL